MTSQTRLRVRNLTKQFESEILSDLSFEVGDDEIVALLGPSGCGKTTTLRCIAGVESPDSGEIVIDGQKVEAEGVSKPPDERGIGMVYQSYAIWPHKTVAENVRFPLKYADHSVPADAYEKRVDELLDLVEITELKEMPATDLSGGQKQRTALARALVHDPDLLLLDEPLSNLDRQLRKSMRGELQTLQRELGVSMLYVTHDQEEAFHLADRILVMREGEIVEAGTAAKLYRRPESAFTREFVGQWNRFDGRLQERDGSQVLETAFGDLPADAVEIVPEQPVDGAVRCFLRPTDLVVGMEAARKNGHLTQHGTIVATGSPGGRFEMQIDIADTEIELTAATAYTEQYQRGQRVEIGIHPDAIKVYPAEQ